MRESVRKLPRLAVIVFLLLTLYSLYNLVQNPKLKRSTAQRASFNHQFLITDLGTPTVFRTLDLRNTPQLLSYILPGYPTAMIFDRTLWLDYFSREVETRVTSANFSRGSLYGRTLHMSWTGCLDIYRRYGADLLVIGASDVAQELPPDELAQYFPGQKILICASPSLTLGATVEFLRLLQDLHQPEKIKHILFGISATVSHTASLYYPVIDNFKVQLLEDYRRARFLGKFSYLMNRMRLPISWNDILPAPSDRGNLPLPDRLARLERGQALGRWSIFDFPVSPEILRDPERIQALRASNRQVPYYFAGQQDPDCTRTRELVDLLDQLKTRANEISENSLFYLAPTLGDELKDAPSCYLPSVKSAMSQLNDSQTLAVTPSLQDFGLDVGDFAFAEYHGNKIEYRLDMAHPNYLGAQKVTRFLANSIKKRFEN